MQAETHDPSSSRAPHALLYGTRLSLYLCKASTGLARSPRPCLTAQPGHCGQRGCSRAAPAWAGDGGVCTPILPRAWGSPARLPGHAAAAAVAGEVAAGRVVHVSECRAASTRCGWGRSHCCAPIPRTVTSLRGGSAQRSVCREGVAALRDSRETSVQPGISQHQVCVRADTCPQ